MQAIHILAHNATQEALFVQLDQGHMGSCRNGLGDISGLALAGPGLLVCLELPFSWTCIGIGILVEPPGWQYTLSRNLDLGRRGGDTCVLESIPISVSKIHTHT